MARSVLALVVGLLFGVIATLLLRPAPLALPDLGDLQPSVAAPVAPAEAVVSAAAREGGPNFYRRLADENVSELAAVIRQAAAEPKSTERELALAVLLKRYSELDALGAVRLAREAGVGGMALSAVYGAWARKAPGQALAALSTVESPDAAATVAIALIEALGNDAAAVRRVGAVLAAREGDDLGANGTSPAAAIVSPVGPVGFPLRSALAIAAQRWADLDPRRAFGVARELDDEPLRRALESAALRALARTAPDEAFAHFATLDSDSQQLEALGGTLIELARADPERLLGRVADLPADARRLAENAAIQQLAARDPLAALRYVERLSGPEREGMLQVVARSYGMRDAAAALAWARSQPGRDILVGSVIGGVAERDPNRAVDLALELSSPMERMRAVQMAIMTGARQDDAAEAMATRLLAADDGGAMAYNAVQMWASRSPDRAMSWLLANGQSAPPNVFTAIGQQLAQRDPRGAVAYTTQVPSAARSAWVFGVAQGYAQNDPQGAVNWVGQFRGEEWYASSAITIAQTLAQRDGAAAARLVDQLETKPVGPQAQQLANIIAVNWANREPAAAAAWALDRPTEQERTAAVRSAVGVWSMRDVDGATQWALALPQGATRDTALAGVLQATVSRGPSGLDTRVLNAFASEAARQQAVMQVVQGLAYADPARARSIADAHLTDAAIHAQAERVIEAARNDPQRGLIGLGVSQGQAPVLRGPR